jgi:hypothetical protein
VTLPQVALLASPLLGPATWSPTADALVDHGWRVLVAPRLAEAPHSPATVLEHLLNCLPVGSALALVAHSNAGLYLPSLAAERSVVASVYADAALPAANGATPLAPPAMQDFLKQLVDDDGLLHRGRIGGTRRSLFRCYLTPPLEPQWWLSSIASR